MRVFNLVLLITIGTVFCNQKESKAIPIGQYYIPVLYELTVRAQREARAASCRQPGAVNQDGDSNIFSSARCITNRVESGAIYDANTAVKIVLDTISAGASYKCICPISGKVANYSHWSRTDNANVGKDNPPLTSIPVFSTLNPDKILSYPNHYNQTDNLYCIVSCAPPISPTEGTTSQDYYYQILKIR